MWEKNTIPDVVTFALAVIAWSFPNITLCMKVFATLLLIIASLCFHCFHLTSERKDLEKQLERVKSELAVVNQRHDALSVQFKEEFAKTQRYKTAFFYIRWSFHLACQNTKSAKLEDLHKIILYAMEELNRN